MKTSKFLSEIESDKSLRTTSSYSNLISKNNVIYSDYQESYKSKLPQNLNIFNEITLKYAKITNAEMKLYVEELIDSIRDSLIYFNSIVRIENRLSKPCLNILDDDTALLEWNFDHFRFGFSFEEDKDESSYFIISTDPVEQSIKTESYALREKDFKVIADSVVEYIVRNT